MSQTEEERRKKIDRIFAIHFKCVHDEVQRHHDALADLNDALSKELEKVGGAETDSEAAGAK